MSPKVVTGMAGRDHRAGADQTLRGPQWHPHRAARRLRSVGGFAPDAANRAVRAAWPAAG